MSKLFAKQLRRDLDAGLHLGYRRLEYFSRRDKDPVREDPVKYKQDIYKYAGAEHVYTQWSTWAPVHEGYKDPREW